MATPNPPLERRALRDGVYDRLLELLLDGSLAPGQNLSIDGLARELQVSPTPVREAFVHLEHTGLVTRTALRGYRVSPPLTVQQMRELVDAREILEVAALERAMTDMEHLVPDLTQAHNDHIKVLKKIDARTSGVISGISNYREYFDADWAFHLAIIRNANNRYILQTMENLGTHVHRLRQSYTQGISDAHNALDEHAVVLSAVTSGDPALAMAAMRLHLDGVRGRSSIELVGATADV